MEEQKQPASHLVNVPECCRQASEQLYTVSCSLLKNGIFAKIHYSCHIRKQKDGFYSCLPRLFHHAFLSYKKYVSIFHLPPFRMHIVDCKMYRLVEDAVFMPFIFHPHLPSSTRCFRGYFNSNDLENKWICPISYPFISLKAFHFPYSL